MDLPRLRYEPPFPSMFCPTTMMSTMKTSSSTSMQHMATASMAACSPSAAAPCAARYCAAVRVAATKWALIVPGMDFYEEKVTKSLLFVSNGFIKTHFILLYLKTVCFVILITR